MDEKDFYRSYHCVLDRLRCNDPKENFPMASEQGWPLGYGRQLGEALQNNTVVDTIWLNVNDILDIREEMDLFGNYLLGKEVYAHGFDPRHLDSYIGSSKLLHQFLQISASLRTVLLKMGRSESHFLTDHLRDLLVTAVARNPHITKFQFDTWISPDSFSYLLSATQSITHLYFQVRHFDAQDAYHDTIMINAMVSNRTLRHLLLSDIEQPALAQAIVSQLATHASNSALQCLSIQPCYLSIMPVLEALPSLLRESSKLEEVVLTFHFFDDLSWQQMYEALLAAPTLKKLTLCDCIFGRKGTSKFVEIMSQRALPEADDFALREARDGAGWSGELRLVLDDKDRMFTGTDFASVIAGILTNRSPAVHILHLDIVSSLLDEQDESDWFFEDLMLQEHEEDSEIKLPCLRMHNLHEKELPYLIDLLPRATHLRELTIFSVYKWNGKDLKRHAFLPAVHANGSLHQVAVGAHDQRPFMTPAQWRFARACTDRNRVVPTLLGSENVTPALVPRLFAAAHAAPRATPSVLLQGLLAAARADVDWSQMWLAEGKGRVKRVPPADNPPCHES
jgi:hypothetical protein